MKFVVIGNSKHLPESDFMAVAARADRVIAADGGANHCFRLKVDPSLIVGDLDSISEEARKSFETKSTFETHRRDKNQLDLVLACHRAEDLGATQIDVFGGSDERVDYSVSLLLGLVAVKAELRLWTKTSQIHLLNLAHPHLTLTGPAKVSILSLGTMLSLKSQGLHWELNWNSVGPQTSQSNEVSESGSIDVTEGSAWIVIDRSPGLSTPMP